MGALEDLHRDVRGLSAKIDALARDTDYIRIDLAGEFRELRRWAVAAAAVQIIAIIIGTIFAMRWWGS